MLELRGRLKPARRFAILCANTQNNRISFLRVPAYPTHYGPLPMAIGDDLKRPVVLLTFLLLDFGSFLLLLPFSRKET